MNVFEIVTTNSGFTTVNDGYIFRFELKRIIKYWINLKMDTKNIYKNPQIRFISTIYSINERYLGN